MSALTANVALLSDTPVVDFSQVSIVAAALNKQVTRDFGPLWEVGATVSGFDTLESVPVDYWPVIIRDDINQPGAAGYHTDDNGQPFSLVQADDSWALTSSHEALEMLADPFGNRTIAGSPPPASPDPISQFDRVIYLVEVCDPCESEQLAYTVNGVTVSDFITPHYYDPNGNLVGHDEDALPPGSARSYFQQRQAALADGFAGSAIVQSPTGQPLVAIASEVYTPP